MSRRVAFALLLLAAPGAWALESSETYRGALGAFLKGRLEEASNAYRYLATLGIDGAAPSANLAVVARDQGAQDEALAQWLRATMLEPYDSFAWSQRGWTYLSTGRHRDARDAFRKAVEVSSAPHQAAEAGFGLGLTEQLDGGAKAAIAAYQTAYSRSPYLLPAVSAQLGRLAVKLGRGSTAELYYKQSLTLDPRQPDVARELAQVYEKSGSARAAWQGYKMVLDLDPADPVAKKGVERTAKYILEKPERLLPVRRLGRPLLTHFEPPPLSPQTRIGLFADANGDSAHVTRFSFISGSGFRIAVPQMGEITRGTALEQWEVAYQLDTRIIEVRDAARNLKYTSKQPFRIESLVPGASLLVKSPALGAPPGVDIGDRELRGAVEVVPTPSGFQLVNELALEDYLTGVVSASLPSESPREALRAEAVLARTRAFGAPRFGHNGFLKTELCDSDHCRVYSGLTQEHSAAREAVASTLGGRLFQNGVPAATHEHVSCGWATTPRGEDRAAPAGMVASAADLERLLHAYPSEQLYCETSALAQPSWSRWVRLLSADAVRERLERSKNVGRLHGLRVASRDATGRVEAVDVQGSRETARVEGAAAIESLLNPGGLRSMLFSIQPIYRGKVLDHLLVWGAGTGDGRGFCRAGAMGQGQVGRRYRDILAHYFPGSEVRGAPPEPEGPPVLRAGKGGVTEREKDRARAKRAARLRAAQKARAARAGVERSTSPAQGGRAVEAEEGPQARP